MRSASPRGRDASTMARAFSLRTSASRALRDTRREHDAGDAPSPSVPAPARTRGGREKRPHGGGLPSATSTPACRRPQAQGGLGTSAGTRPARPPACSARRGCGRARWARAPRTPAGMYGGLLTITSKRRSGGRPAKRSPQVMSTRPRGRGAPRCGAATSRRLGPSTATTHTKDLPPPAQGDAAGPGATSSARGSWSRGPLAAGPDIAPRSSATSTSVSSRAADQHRG